jgi:hypothetical protein
MLRGLKDLHGAILDESFRKGMVTGKICTCNPLNEFVKAIFLPRWFFQVFVQSKVWCKHIGWEYENSDPVKYQRYTFASILQNCMDMDY